MADGVDQPRLIMTISTAASLQVGRTGSRVTERHNPSADGVESGRAGVNLDGRK